MVDCMTVIATAAANTTSTVATTTVATSGFQTGVQACDDLIAAYEAYMDCDKFKAVGPAAVNAAHDALDAMKQGGEQLRSAPQIAKDAAAAGCRQALDGLRQGALAIGCPL